MRTFKKLARPARHAAFALVAVAGFATAMLVGLAAARTFALTIASGARVTNTAGSTVREPIVVTPGGRAVYTLSSDSRSHPACTKANGCLSFWPPARAGSAHPKAAPGIKGKLGVWHRDGFAQLTLNGHPLYRFSGDSRRAVAGGEGIHGFGGIWHVVRTAGSSSAVSGTTGTTGTTTTTTTTTTPGYTGTTGTTGTTTTTTTPVYTYVYPPAP